MILNTSGTMKLNKSDEISEVLVSLGYKITFITTPIGQEGEFNIKIVSESTLVQTS